MRGDIEKTGKGATRSAAIVTTADIARMRAGAQVTTEQEAKQMKTIREEQKGQQQAAAKARKTKMMQMDRNRGSKLPASEIEVEQNQRAEGLLSKAQQQLDEEHDDVKHMNQMTLYAKVVTVRDKQLNENKDLEQDWVSEQKRLDLMMEIERLKALKAEDERERLRVEAKRRGAAVIIEQIKEREVMRVKEREQLEREQHQMVKTIELQKAADLKVAEAKKHRNTCMLEEVEVTNKIALDRKQEKLR